MSSSYAYVKKQRYTHSLTQAHEIHDYYRLTRPIALPYAVLNAEAYILLAILLALERV